MSAPRTSPLTDRFPATVVTEEVGDALVPWRFSTLDEEYAHLRGDACAFDLSGAALLAIDGAAAEDFTSDVFTREVDFLSPESSVIGMLLGDDGAPIDVVTVFRTDTGFLVETAVGRGTATLAHLRAHAPDDVTVRDLRDERVLLGFEGPASWSVAEAVLDEPVTGLPFQGVRAVTCNGVPVTVSRTGYTGEFGFEVAVPTERVGEVWDRLVEHAPAAGHETLEVGMLEVRQPMLHREVLDPAGAVVRGGFNWLVDLEKETFVGRDALEEQRDAGPDALAVSFACAQQPTAGAKLVIDGQAVGQVVYSAWSPGLGEHFGIAHLDPDLACSGLVLGADGVDVPVRTVSAPVVVPASWGSMVTGGGTP